LRFIADDFTMTDFDPGGLLIKGDIPGSRGGLNAGAGILINCDTRDNIFDTYKGWYVESNIDRHGSYLGSDFTYTRISLDVRRFFTFSAKDRLAAQFFTESFTGEVPFISQALIGGTRRMRGFYEGRYRDNHSMITQVEYRRHILGRLGAVAFASAGTVAPRYGGLSVGNVRYAFGGGLRVALDREDRINIRFDVGIGNGEPAYYVTVGEAF
jgi:outer membrane protein assembly factor BamA